MEDATLLKACRIVCAKTRNGFCQNVGGALGCKVGRGTSDPEQCVANIDQQILSGNEAIASAILELGRQQGIADGYDMIRDMG